MKKILLLIISLFSINQTTCGQEVTIGSQIWNTTNLDVTTYRDGTPIPQVTDPTAWATLTTGAWCYYNNTTANGTIYGKLYNWYAVVGIHDTDPNTPNKILAPNGYHIPSDTEWTTLINFLGGMGVAGGKMKSTGTIQAGNGLWESPNDSATNLSGFTGLPSGFRNKFGGVFGAIGVSGFWWTSSQDAFGSNYATYCRITSQNGTVEKGPDSKENGFSVRYIKDGSLSNATFDTNSLKLYPNPVESVLNIKTENNLINQPYTIIDGLGRIVLNGKLNEVDTTINVEQLSKGIYYLKVSGNSSSKFIKE
jgi:uncharacterized protein (TIGR02145 family)